MDVLRLYHFLFIYYSLLKAVYYGNSRLKSSKCTKVCVIGHKCIMQTELDCRKHSRVAFKLKLWKLVVRRTCIEAVFLRLVGIKRAIVVRSYDAMFYL